LFYDKQVVVDLILRFFLLEGKEKMEPK